VLTLGNNRGDLEIRSVRSDLYADDERKATRHPDAARLGDTGSLMSPEVPVQRNFSRRHGHAQEKVEHLDRAIDTEIAWYVLPAYAENANKKVRYLLVCRIRSGFTARFTVLPFRFPILLLAFFVLNNPDDLDADADVSLHQEFDAAFL
jgi:hypothetical protein